MIEPAVVADVIVTTCFEAGHHGVALATGCGEIAATVINVDAVSLVSPLSGIRAAKFLFISLKASS